MAMIEATTNAAICPLIPFRLRKPTFIVSSSPLPPGA
jgi:hypothetical protein